MGAAILLMSVPGLIALVAPRTAAPALVVSSSTDHLVEPGQGTPEVASMRTRTFSVAGGSAHPPFYHITPPLRYVEPGTRYILRAEGVSSAHPFDVGLSRLEPLPAAFAKSGGPLQGHVGEIIFQVPESLAYAAITYHSTKSSSMTQVLLAGVPAVPDSPDSQELMHRHSRHSTHSTLLFAIACLCTTLFTFIAFGYVAYSCWLLRSTKGMRRAEKQHHAPPEAAPRAAAKTGAPIAATSMAAAPAGAAPTKAAPMEAAPMEAGPTKAAPMEAGPTVDRASADLHAVGSDGATGAAESTHI